VLALLVLIISAVAIPTTPTDIFPSIDIPVVAVDWTYSGLNPEELEGRLTSDYERALTANVDNIQAHRVNHGHGPGDRESLPAADRQLGYGECADHRGIAVDPPPIAARDFAAPDHQLQRLEMAGLNHVRHHARAHGAKAQERELTHNRCLSRF
jgi:hypothetical protein